jgi:hypothetical protein
MQIGIQLEFGRLPNAELLRRIEAMKSSGESLDMDARGIQHDHVWSRRWLQNELSRDCDNARITAVLREFAWGCTLTKTEHDAVGKKLEGWDKYREAGVHVFDFLERVWKT